MPFSRATQPDFDLPPPPGTPRARRVKRLVDLLGASALIAATAPAFLLIPALVRLESPGPVIFRQTRVGREGRPFTLYKFRSMVDGADDQIDDLLERNDLDGPVFKMRRDPRVTGIGRLLRRWSLDELPQLVNVIRGDMSLVGPRPALPREVADYTPRQRLRLRVPPGLTCTWQVSGRSTLPFGRWIEMDLEYIDTWSLRTDLRICVQTVAAILSGRGAY